MNIKETIYNPLSEADFLNTIKQKKPTRIISEATPEFEFDIVFEDGTTVLVDLENPCRGAELTFIEI